MYNVLDVKTKTILQECIASAKTGKHKCKLNIPIFILGDNVDEVRDHVGDAINNGHPSILSKRNEEHSRRWLQRHKGPGKACSGAQGTQCDEYPFAITNEGGELNGPSLRSVDGSQNGSAGAESRWFYEKCRITSTPIKKFKVIPMKGINTGYICDL